MTTLKRKFDDPIYPETSGPAYTLESRGCDAYMSAAIQYPLIGGNSTFVKLLIGGVVLLIPVIGSLIFTGYGLRATRRVMHGDYRLPEWDDFFNDFVNGLIAAIGLFIFGLLLTLSMVLVVTIPIVVFFGFPMLAYVMARYAETEDFGSFFAIAGAYGAIFSRLGDAIFMSIGSFITVIIFSILVGVGTICLLIPGMMASAALGLALAFNAGVFGRAALRI